MIQKCSLIAVLEVFFKEPTKMHFIREISREIKLAQTSVRNHVKELKKGNLIMEKEGKPFKGFVANRENEKFLFYKRAYNLYSLFELRNRIIGVLHPKAIIVFGSYSRGEDIEGSDVDVLILSKIDKKIPVKDIEKKLKKTINIMVVDSLDRLEKNMRKSASNGWVIYGGV